MRSNAIVQRDSLRGIRLRFEFAKPLMFDILCLKIRARPMVLPGPEPDNAPGK
jgi:hypothetical protein